MKENNAWPATATFNLCGEFICTAHQNGDRYSGVIPDPLLEFLHTNRLRAWADHRIEDVFDSNGEWIELIIHEAKFNLDIIPDNSCRWSPDVHVVERVLREICATDHP